MQQPAQSQPSPISSSFAGLLATLTAPPSERADAPPWSDEDLGEDVATLSYEQALRAHARYRVDDREEPRKTAPAVMQADQPAPAQGNEPAQPHRTAHDLRTASVTVRLSMAECARMHERAAEAGLTVSAYLRSCVLEADALRSQVKQALAEMRETGARGTGKRGNEERSRRSYFGWIARLLPRRRSALAVRQN
jgi:hypothetical protein